MQRRNHLACPAVRSALTQTREAFRSPQIAALCCSSSRTALAPSASSVNHMLQAACSTPRGTIQAVRRVSDSTGHPNGWFAEKASGGTLRPACVARRGIGGPTRQQRHRERLIRPAYPFCPLRRRAAQGGREAVGEHCLRAAGPSCAAAPADRAAQRTRRSRAMRWARLFFGDFLLARQKKVTRRQGGTGVSDSSRHLEQESFLSPGRNPAPARAARHAESSP